MGSTPSGSGSASATDIETTSLWDRWRVVALPRSPPDTPRVSRAKAIGVLRPLLTSDRHRARLPDASRTIVGTGAGFGLLSMDEALDLADDVGMARIIIGTS
jgi:hypothetical protein